MAIERTDLIALKRGSNHHKATVEDLPRLAIPATRAVLDAAAAGSGIEVDTVYWISDEGRLAIGTSATGYEAMALEAEVGGGGGVILNIDGGNASSIAPTATAIDGGTA